MKTGPVELRPFPRGEITSRRVSENLDPLDLDPEQWQEAFGEPTTGMYYQHVDLPTDELTEVFCFHNDTHLGFAVKCHDYEAEGLDEGRKGWTGSATVGAGADIYLDPGLSGAGVVRLSMSPEGARYEQAYEPGTPHYPHRWKNRSYVTPEYWACVCWVEFKDLGMGATDGDVWGLNVVRRERKTEKLQGRRMNLAPFYDFFKFPEQLCSLRFGEPAPLEEIELDQSRGGVAALRLSLRGPQKCDRVRVELRPCCLGARRGRWPHATGSSAGTGALVKRVCRGSRTTRVFSSCLGFVFRIWPAISLAGRLVA